MLSSSVAGLAFLALLLAAWVAVQQAWRRAFPDAGPDADGLEGRLGCHGTCANTICPRRSAEGACAGEEEEA
jgi:hypothetical protein